MIMWTPHTAYNIRKQY